MTLVLRILPLLRELCFRVKLRSGSECCVGRSLINPLSFLRKGREELHFFNIVRFNDLCLRRITLSFSSRTYASSGDCNGSSKWRSNALWVTTFFRLRPRVGLSNGILFLCCFRLELDLPWVKSRKPLRKRFEQMLYKNGLRAECRR